MTRRELITEALLGGAWVDLTTYVQQSRGVTVSRVRPQQSASFELLDNDGRFSSRNPHGPYTGLWGRNVEMRQRLVLSRASFTPASTPGWSATETGQHWVHAGIGGTVALTDWSQAGGVARHSVPASGAYRASWMHGGGLLRDVRIGATVALAITNITGGSVEHDLILRELGADYYHGRVEITTAEQVFVSFHRAFAGQIAAPVQVPGLVHTSAQALRIVAEIEEQTMRIKVWPAGTPEPAAWHLEHVDTTNALPSPGTVGLRSGVAAGNTNAKPLIFSVDDFEVSSPRYYGELSSSAPRWTKDHTLSNGRGHRTVAVKSGGVLQRLAQGKSPIRSALRRWVPTSSPGLVAYWPLSEGELGTTAAPVVGLAPVVLSPRQAPSVYWGKGSLGSLLDPGVAMQGADNLTFNFDMPNFTTEWCVDHVRASAHGSATALTIITTRGNWSVTFHANTDIQVIRPDGGTLSYGVIPGSQLGSDDGPHFIRFRAEQTGADVFWALSIDGIGVLSQVWAGATLGAGYAGSFVDFTAHTDANVIGQLMIYTTRSDLATAVSVFRGRPGERAGRRLQRLCAEEGIAFMYSGNLDTTRACGPQGIATVRALLDETANVDLTTVYEPRTALAVGFRALSTMWNAPVAVSLSHAAGEVTSLVPIEDDQLTRNRWTAKRPGGGEYTANALPGPLDAATVGLYDSGGNVNAVDDTYLRPHAEFRVAAGTVDEPRYSCTVATHSATVDTSRLWSLCDVDIDDRIDVTDVDDEGIFDTVRMLVRGYVETFNTGHDHRLTFDGVPAAPYRVAVLDSPTLGRLDTLESKLATGVNSSATALSVTAGTLWTTTGTPFPIMVGGEEMTVTAVVGAASPQTFTVTRSVNGVVKSHAADAPVRVAPWAAARLAV